MGSPCHDPAALSSGRDAPKLPSEEELSHSLSVLCVRYIWLLRFTRWEGTCLSGRGGRRRPCERKRSRCCDWQPKGTKMSLKSGHRQAAFESDDATPGFCETENPEVILVRGGCFKTCVGWKPSLSGDPFWGRSWGMFIKSSVSCRAKRARYAYLWLLRKVAFPPASLQ